MNVMLVQGTWSDDANWWKQDVPGNFADAVKRAGHTLVNGRPFIWSTELAGVNPFSSADLRAWRGAGRHLWDRLAPPLCTGIKIPDLCIIAHSHGRQVVKYACHYGLTVDRVILVSGPIRKDVDRETPNARRNIGRLVCLHGGQKDRMQIYGGLFDGFVGRRRDDPDANVNESYADSGHSTFLNDPAQFIRVIKHLK